jgi:hypothetical protein
MDEELQELLQSYQQLESNLLLKINQLSPKPPYLPEVPLERLFYIKNLLSSGNGIGTGEDYSSPRLIGGIDPDGDVKAIAVSESGFIQFTESNTEESNEGLIRQYDYPWVSVRTLANTAPDTFNSAPDNGSFIAVGATEISTIEILLDAIAATNAPSSIVVAIWVGENIPIEKNLLCLIGVSAGENRASVLAGKAYLAAGRIFADIKQSDANLKFAVRVFADISTVVVTPDLSTGTTNFICANPGFSSAGTEQIAFTTSGVLPPGLSGYVSAANAATDAITLVGMSPSVGEALRLNFNTLQTTSIPHWGIAARVVCADIDINSNTLTLLGSAVDFSLFKNRNIRLRAAPASTLPTALGTALSATANFQVITVSGTVGNQTVQLGNDGGVPLMLSNQGVGWFYVFPYPFIDVTLNASNVLAIAGVSVDIKNDLNAMPVAVTAGTAATITQANAFSNVTPVPVALGGSSAPGGATLGTTFYTVPGTVTGTQYSVSVLPGGLPIAFGSAGSSVTFNGTAATVTPGTPSAVTLPNHFLSTGQPITLAGAPLPGATFSYGTLYVISTGLSNNSFQLSQTKGFPGVVFGSTGTNVTLTAQVAAATGFYPIEKTLAFAQSIDDSTIRFLASSGGSQIQLTGVGSGTLAVTPVAAPTISGNIRIRPIL